MVKLNGNLTDFERKVCIKQIYKNGDNLVPKWFLHVFCTFVYSHCLPAQKKTKIIIFRWLPFEPAPVSSASSTAATTAFCCFWNVNTQKRIFYCECENNFLCIECGRGRIIHTLHAYFYIENSHRDYDDDATVDDRGPCSGACSVVCVSGNHRFGPPIRAKWIGINWLQTVSKVTDDTRSGSTLSVKVKLIDLLWKKLDFQRDFGNVIRAKRWAKRSRASRNLYHLNAWCDGGRNVLDLLVLNACVKYYMYEPNGWNGMCTGPRIVSSRCRYDMCHTHRTSNKLNNNHI